MVRGKLRLSCYPVKLTVFFSLFLGAMLLATPACIPPEKTPPPIKTPSKVITEGGYEFFVYGLKLPGSRQEVKLKKDDTLTWLPLSIVRVITFTGPEADRFRPADIYLTSAGRGSRVSSSWTRSSKAAPIWVIGTPK